MSSWKNILVSAVWAVLSTVGSSAFADDSVLTLWQKDIRLRPPGVHECGDTLFVTVRLPLARGDDPEEKELEASALAHDVLAKWAFERMAPDREAKAGGIPPGVRKAGELVESCLRSPRILSWRIQTEMREFVDSQARDAVVLGQAFDRNAVIAAIPQSFSEPTGDLDWRTGLTTIIRPRVSGKPDIDFLRSIGAADAIVATAAPLPEFPDWEDGSFSSLLERFLDEAFSVDETEGSFLKDYLLQASDAIRAEALAVLAPTEETNRTIVVQPVRCSTNTVVSVSTNAIVPEAFDSTMREITKSRPSGLPASASVSGIVRDLEVYSVRTNVTMTIEIVKESTVVIRNLEWCGEPRFQMLFLSAGLCGNEPSLQTSFGKSAAKAFYSSSTTSEDKAARLHDALCENPGDAALWNLYGRTLLEGGDAEGAVISLLNALRLDIANEFVWANLSTAWSRLGRDERAIGAALVARGLAKSEWTVRTAEAVLLKPAEKTDP